MDDLEADGNTVVLVDHDTQVLAHADWMVEMGPDADANGGTVIAQGTVPDIERNPASVIGPYLSGGMSARVRDTVPQSSLFDLGRIRMATTALHTVKPLDVTTPKGRLTVVTGVSGSGKTTMVLESLVPALQATIDGSALPMHVTGVEAAGIGQVKLIDATPTGINIRSTVATYANVHDALRKAFAATPQAKKAGRTAGAFSYNTGDLRCPACDGTGTISLDVQFLPDVEIECPDCHGTRYGQEASTIAWTNKAGASYTLPALMAMSVDEALEACAGLPSVLRRLRTLHDLCLGYLTLGEDTPGLSGGEAGGTVVVSGTVNDVRACPRSVTERYI